MATQAEARAKRQATEDALEYPPSKFARSSTSNDIGKRRRKKPPVKTPSKTRAVAKDEAGASHNSSKADSPTQLPSQPGATPEGSELDTSRRSQVDTSNDQFGDNSEHSQDQQEGEDSDQDGEGDNNAYNVAITFVKQFQLILERRRAASKAALTSAQTTKHLESIAHLCELAAQQDMFLNLHLVAEGFLPEWWRGMSQLEAGFDDLFDLGKQSRNCAEAFDRAGEAYDAAVSARDAVLYADEESSDEVRRALDEEVANARDEYWRRQEWWIEAQAEYDRDKEHIQEEVAEFLDDGERYLVAAGHLRVWSADDSKSLPSARSRSPSRAAEDIEDAELQAHAAYLPQQGQNQDSENPQQPNAQPTQAESIIAALRREQNDDLERARAAYSAASEDFAALRTNYTRRLVAFLEAQQHNAAVGTRTDFDNRTSSRGTKRRANGVPRRKRTGRRFRRRVRRGRCQWGCGSGFMGMRLMMGVGVEGRESGVFCGRRWRRRLGGGGRV